MKRRFYAQVRLTIVRQVEFDADDCCGNSYLQDLAIELATAEWGDADIKEVEDIEMKDGPEYA